MDKSKYLNDILTEHEAESMVKNLEPISLEQYCSEEFIKHIGTLVRLNMQAVKNSLSGGEDFIMTLFVDNEKLNDLITELFVALNFKKHIYPLIKNEVCDKYSMKTYICLYNEAIVINILENFFYHLTACQAAGDYLVDIVEYCYMKLIRLVNLKPRPEPDAARILSPEEDMEIKSEELEYNIALSCLSIMRYITDHLQALPFPVINHIVHIKDVPMLLVAVMECRPWLRKKGEEVYENNRWAKVTSAKMPKLEGQVWIALFNLFMNQDTTKKYEITEYRKTNLLRLRKYLNETVFDQIPPLQQFYRSLEELSIMEVNSTPSSNPFVVEMKPHLLNAWDKCDFKEIAEKILKNNFKAESYKRELGIISEIFSTNNMEYFMEDPKCANCGKDATNRCSRCKSEWYCSKECQIQRWKLHKELCATFVELNKEQCRKEEMTVIKERKLNELD
jgi:predicted Zn-ribbon and HTH transcriptional regulator